MITNRKARRSARQLYRLCLVDGALDEGRARLVAERIAQSGRHGSLAMLSSFLRLVRLDRDRRTAVVESAEPLSSDMRDDLQQRLSRSYGEGLATSFALNPALIGGVRIRVGSDVFDGSVRARLAALEARF